ncbi:hypothetical protein LSM04_003211 [Trypanosoma melophagium]|uniref:uncharacterized protein n=1 Tax=Trypanosoma melophagium TaxID=715481 RepID=UPI00351A98B6|nr:hypothetical protein LSM04_003211 [Trypanosoma melophagium]
MDAFQVRLDGLQKQSKEQIMSAIAGLQEACDEGAQPMRVAVAIGNRIIPSQIANSFPVICFIDAMTIQKEDPYIAGVLEEFWRIAPSLFVNYATADEALREKVTRAVKRWGLKKVFTSSVCDKLVAAISGNKIDDISDDSKIIGDKDLTHSSGDGRRGINDGFTRSEVSGFCTILQNCMKMIERLPPHRATMYLEVVRKEKLLRTPSKSALLFFQGLHAELTRESVLYNSNVVKNEHQVSSTLNAGSETKVALGNLLDKLSNEQSSSTTPMVSNKDYTFHVVRYISPLQSDICQRLSLAQRSGFGEWHRRSKSEYHYPKKEASTRRMFRAPVGAQAGTRAWFPSEQQWVSENDMATLTLFLLKEAAPERETSSLYNVVRKRERDS